MLEFIVGILSGGLIVWAYGHQPRDLESTNKRIDSVLSSLQREAQERGKLAKRLAQAETKIARLLKPKHIP